MKKWSSLLLAVTMLLPSFATYGLEGEMGYFGGITPGTKLPTTAQRLDPKASKKTTKYTLPYEETVYVTGKPIGLEGTLEVRPAKYDKADGQGKYTETYIVKASDAKTKSSITRNISFDTDFIYDPALRQMTKTSSLKKWTETIVIEGKTYQLDNRQSSFSKSMLEDYTPGVMYYRGDVQYEAVYRDVSNGDGTNYVTVSVNGPIYGYDAPYAKTETQKRSITVYNGQNQYYIEETPTFTMHKDIQYGANQPEAMSFGGNYKELIRGEGNLSYNILVGDSELYDDELVGSTSVTDTPSIEQLPIPAMPQLKGHPAQGDITKMYSLGIFDQVPSTVSPNQVVTKGEYITMLVKALHIPIPELKEKKAKKDEPIAPPVFTDLRETSTYYPYALAAYEAGLISGGRFDGNVALTREQMYLYNIRAIGLERLGIGSGGIYTPFIDDQQISSWAKNSIYAATKIGLIPAANGYLYPKKKVTYAEAATFLGQMIDYLRYDLQKDYNEKMMY